MIKNATFKQKKYFIHIKNLILSLKNFVIEKYSKLTKEDKKKLAIYTSISVVCILLINIIWNITNPGDKIPSEIYKKTTTEDSLYKTINADKKVVYVNLKDKDNSTANIIKNNIEYNDLKENFGKYYYLYIDWDKNPGCSINEEICAHKFFSNNCEEICIINPIKKRYIETKYNFLNKKIKRYKNW